MDPKFLSRHQTEIFWVPEKNTFYTTTKARRQHLQKNYFDNKKSIDEQRKSGIHTHQTALQTLSNYIQHFYEEIKNMTRHNKEELHQSTTDEVG